VWSKEGNQLINEESGKPLRIDNYAEWEIVNKKTKKGKEFSQLHSKSTRLAMDIWAARHQLCGGKPDTVTPTKGQRFSFIPVEDFVPVENGIDCSTEVTCPAGFLFIPGNLPHWNYAREVGKVQGLETEEDCADRCRNESMCLSFQFKSGGSCLLYNEEYPIQETKYGYKFCSYGPAH